MITAYPVPGKAKSQFICEAFLAGALKSAEGAVFFGTEGQSEAFRKAQNNGRPWWYIDNSYLDKHRGIYFRVTKNALQVDPRGKTSDGKRFAKLGVPIKPWRENPDGYLLLVPQSDQFMKSTGYIGDWTTDTVRLLGARGETNIRVHPWNRDKLARNETFTKLLPGARQVIVFSSAAAITACLEGVPSLSMSPTAAHYWMSSRPTDAERLRFAQVLADNQFSLHEFRDGTAWRWLNR